MLRKVNVIVGDFLKCRNVLKSIKMGNRLEGGIVMKGKCGEVRGVIK